MLAQFTTRRDTPRDLVTSVGSVAFPTKVTRTIYTETIPLALCDGRTHRSYDCQFNGTTPDYLAALQSGLSGTPRIPALNTTREKATFRRRPLS